MRKKKHELDIYLPQKIFFRFVLPLLFGVTILLPSASLATGDRSLSTGNDVGTIEHDSATGNRVMKTLGPRPQQEPQGSQIIIVAPQIYPGGSSGVAPGGPPGSGHRPPPSGPKPSHPPIPLLPPVSP